MPKLHCLKEDNENFILGLEVVGDYFFIKRVYHEAQYCYETILKMLQKDISKIMLIKQMNCLFFIGICLSRRKNYNSALKLLSDALNLHKDVLNPQQRLEFEGDCFREIGLCQKRLNLKEEAWKSYQSALASYRSCDCKPFAGISFCMMNLGIFLYHENKFKDALYKFKELFDFYYSIYSKYSNINLLHKAKCLFYLGCCLQNLNQHDSASKYLHNAVVLYQEDMDDKNVSEFYRAYSLMRIAKCFLTKSDHEQAIEHLFKSLRLWKNLRKSFPDDQDLKLSLAINHKHIGNCFLKFHFYKEAIDPLKRSLQIFKDLKRKRDCLDLNRRLGLAYKNLGNFQQACDFYKACFRYVDNKTTLKSKADLKRWLGNCMKKLNYPEADEKTKSALKGYLTLYKFEEEDRISLLRCIGLCYWNLGDLKQTNEYFELYVAHSEKQMSFLSMLDRFNVVITLKIIGLSFAKEHNWDSAYQFFKRSLDKALKLPKTLKYVPEIAFLYNRIGKYWLHRNFLDFARTNFEEVEKLSDILTLTLKSKQTLGITYKNLGRVFSLENPPQYSRAISYFKKAEKMLSDLDHQKFRSDIAWMLKIMGRCCKEQKQFEEAIEYFKKSEENYRSFSDADSVLIEIVYVVKSIGLSYQLMHEHDLAIANFEKSVYLYSKMQNLHEKAWVLKNMALSYKAQNSYFQAFCCLQDSLTIHKNMPVEKQNKNEMEDVKGVLESLRQNR